MLKSHALALCPNLCALRSVPSSSLKPLYLIKVIHGHFFPGFP